MSSVLAGAPRHGCVNSVLLVLQRAQPKGLAIYVAVTSKHLERMFAVCASCLSVSCWMVVCAVCLLLAISVISLQTQASLMLGLSFTLLQCRS